MTLRIAIDGRALNDRNPGVGRYVWNLARALPRVAEEEAFHLLTAPDNGGSTRFPLAELEALEVRRAEVKQSRLDLRQRALPRLLAELDAGVLHVPHAVAAYRVPCPLVVTVYDSLAAAPESARKAERSLGQALADAGAVIALSQAVRRELGDRFAVEPRRVTVIPGAADPDLEEAPAEAVREVRERLKLPARCVLCLGSARPHKNLVRLVEAWAEVKKTDVDEGGSWQLVLAGAHDRGDGGLREKARALGLDDVYFLGEVAEADLAAVLSAAEVFVQPSLAEGSGLTVLEAMACGTAVACSRTSALPAVAGAGAAYFDPESPPAIAATLVRLMKNGAYRQMLAERGAQRAEQLSWENAARQTLKVYRRVAAEGEG